jgi:hypothetical protein
MSQASLLVQHDLSNSPGGIKAEQTTDVKDITHHPQEAIHLFSRTSVMWWSALPYAERRWGAGRS